MVRSFENKQMEVGVNFLLRTVTGQTLETLALTGEEEPVQKITGFRLKSYVRLSWSYQFGR